MHTGEEMYEQSLRKDHQGVKNKETMLITAVPRAGGQHPADRLEPCPHACPASPPCQPVSLHHTAPLVANQQLDQQ